MPTAAAPAAPAPATPPSNSEAKAAAAQTPPKEAEKPTEKIRVRGYERAKQYKQKLDAEESTAEEADDEPAKKPKPEPKAKTEPVELEPEPKAKPKPAPSPAKTEPDEKPEPKPKAKAEAADEESEPDPAEKRRRERHERLRQAAERERREQAEREAKSKSKQQQTALERELEGLRKKVAELEPLNSVFSSEEALLEEAERRNMSAEKLVSWMRTKLSDPAAVATRQAKTEADKIREEMRALQKRLDDEAEQRRTERAQYEAQQEGMHKALSFIDRSKRSTDSHPLTAALHAKHGDKGLVDFANQFVAPMLSESYSVEELHDHVEELLERVQVAGLGTPEAGKSHHTKNGADQPPTTLSSRATQERASVTEALPLHRMAKRDRHQLLRDKYRREQ